MRGKLKPIITTCDFCGDEYQVKDCNVGSYYLSLRTKQMAFCSSVCSCLYRRRTKEEKQKVKHDYDQEYTKRPDIKVRKKKVAKEYFQRTYDPVKAAIERKKNMHKHVEYCRKPEYKVKKHEYDIKRHAKKYCNNYYESHMLLKEITSLYDGRRLRIDAGLTNKTQKRKRHGKSKNSPTLKR